MGETGERTCRVIQEEYTVGEFLNNGIASPGPVRQTHDLWAITPFLPPHIYIQYNVLPPSCSLLMLTFISVLFFSLFLFFRLGNRFGPLGFVGQKHQVEEEKIYRIGGGKGHDNGCHNYVTRLYQREEGMRFPEFLKLTFRLIYLCIKEICSTYL